ncbi:zinc finger protein 593-like family protein [Necator americanus]|uniref:Zinc finger protein 593 homolog n=1 Tax=Necator americanus TaxID=51031 RepID=W2SYN8_NECAM|nr:zinc finger protein 593-like family protein [Necator americanus]ETN74755.1 zinc finger protein 593-like family protein [Necator americanus]
MPSNSQRKHTISNKVRKRPGKDLDQIHEDLKPNKAAKLLRQEVDFDLPGDGQFYCIECERYFIDEKTRSDHRKSKLHKNRVRSLKEVPYSMKEAEAAAGHGTYKHVTLKSKLVSEEKMDDDIKKEKPDEAEDS